MHHVVVVDRWSRGNSVLHVREARAKIVVSVALLAAIATTPVDRQTAFAAYFCLLLAGVVLARLPLIPLMIRAALVLPFSLTFAAISLLAGDPLRALLLLEKSFLSAIAVLLLVGTTPLPGLLKGLERPAPAGRPGAADENGSTMPGRQKRTRRRWPLGYPVPAFL